MGHPYTIMGKGTFTPMGKKSNSMRDVHITAITLYHWNHLQNLFFLVNE